MKRTVLVTGAAGFIGSHVAEHCIKLGMNVVAVDDLSGGSSNNIPRGAIFRCGCLTKPTFVKAIFSEFRFDYVYHLAAYAAEGLSHFIRHYNYETNLQASILLINAAVRSKVKCFVFTSSIAVYGTGQNPMTEDMQPRPEDPYGISKFAVELDLEAAHRMFGMNYIIFRPHNVYGERQNIADRYRNVIGIFMNQVLQGKPMSIFGDGMQTRAFSHVDDVAPIVAIAPTKKSAYNQIYNIGADQPYSIMELATQVARVMKRRKEVVHLDPRNEVVHAFASHEKVKKEFGNREPISLSAGLTKMARWAKVHGPCTPVKFWNVEIAENLPKAWRNVT